MGKRIQSMHWQIPECAWDYIYIHSKVMVVDDKWLIVGSANAGGISLTGVGFSSEPDTELSAIILDQQQRGSKVKEFRKKVWAEFLQVSESVLEDYQVGSRLFHEQSEGQSYDTLQAKRVHYNILYYPYSNKATMPVNKGVWKHLKWQQIEKQLQHRMQTPDEIHQTYHNLSGPLTVVHILATRDPSRYKKLVKDLYQTGKSEECRVDVSDEDLLGTAIDPHHPILEVDWLVGGAMIDSTNWVLDYQGEVSESVASVIDDGDMISFMKDLIPCGGGVRRMLCIPPNGAAPDKAMVMRATTKTGEHLLNQKTDQVGGTARDSVFVVICISPALLVEANQNAIALNRGKDDFDLGHPSNWISRISDNPFLQLKRDRSYPLYPGVLTPWDVKHILPDRMFIRLVKPAEFIPNPENATKVRLTIWTWGKVSTLTVPIKHFCDTVMALFVGYYTPEARKRAEGDRRAGTVLKGQSLRVKETKTVTHEDVDLTDVKVTCESGLLKVQIKKRVWWTWEKVKEEVVGAGNVFGYSQTWGGSSDQDVQVNITALQDSLYSLEMKSYD